MRRSLLSLCAAIVLALSSAASAFAAPPEKSTENETFIFPDFSLGLVVFINMDRETFCTAEMTAWEEALLEWLEGGEVGDPPEPPEEPRASRPFRSRSRRRGRVRSASCRRDPTWTPRSGRWTRMRRGSEHVPTPTMRSIGSGPGPPGS